MKKGNMTAKILAIATGFFLANGYAASPQSPIGYWKTIDDVSGKPKSIIKISETQDHLLVGQVIKIFPNPGKDPHALCSQCKGEKHNQPIVGMTILTGLMKKEEQWGNGEILDPQNGKTYNCSAKLAANGKKLDVRGYIGLPLLGRSQTWERVDLMSAAVG
jgi:uncharacterized protein (DUF2147 family)